MLLLKSWKCATLCQCFIVRLKQEVQGLVILRQQSNSWHWTYFAHFVEGILQEYEIAMRMREARSRLLDAAEGYAASV